MMSNEFSTKVSARIEIKRTDDDGPTFWSVYVDGGRVSDYNTFRKAWNAARKINPDTATFILDPIDQ